MFVIELNLLSGKKNNHQNCVQRQLSIVIGKTTFLWSTFTPTTPRQWEGFASEQRKKVTYGPENHRSRKNKE